jgi:hypothetical protein
VLKTIATDSHMIKVASNRPSNSMAATDTILSIFI